MEKKLTINGKDYTFKKVELDFDDRIYEDVFADYNNKNLKDTVDASRYVSLKPTVYKKYRDYLSIELGQFLKQLKNNHDFFYKKFLNKYGDSVYSRFRITNKALSLKKGLYIYCINSELKYIGSTTDSFEKRINIGYGNISPKNCYLDGQSTNCHINSLITKGKDKISLFLLDLNCINMQIKKLEENLITEYSPEWNIQLT